MGHVHVLHLPPTLESDRPWSPEPSKKGKKKKFEFHRKDGKIKMESRSGLGKRNGMGMGRKGIERGIGNGITK